MLWRKNKMPANAQLVSFLEKYDRIMIFTGAGISTGSGIPDYRGPGGVWKTRQPVYYQDFMTSEAARIEYWDQKAEGWEGFKSAEPNAAHRAVAQLDKMNKVCCVVTQNIDGLHEKAGIPCKKLVELHGTNLAVECQ
jgi:NAD-dependent deacetylase